MATKKAPGLWSLRSLRLQIALLICMAMAIQGLMRGSFGMAVVCFVNDPVAEDSATNDTSPVPVCGSSNPLSSNRTTQHHELESPLTVSWSVAELSRIHTSFYVGSFVSVLLVDRAIRKLGAAGVMASGDVLSILGCFLTPLVIIFLPSYFFVMGVRLLMGIGYAFVIPCGSVLIACWFPSQEKSTAMALFTTGNQIGIALAMLLTSRICSVEALGGWPLSFALYGTMTMAFLGVWMWRASNKPRQHPSITASELEYITGRALSKIRTVSIVVRTPYSKILSSPSILSIGLCSFAQSFVVIGLVTYLPKYYQQALRMDLSSNGLYSAIPFIVQIVTKLSFAVLADNLKSRGISLDLITKVFNGVASFGGASAIVAISFLGCPHSTLIMVLMATSMGLFSGFVPGYNTSIVSVAPQFTAAVSAYSQIFSQAGSALVPVIIGFVTANGTVEEWQRVFYILAAVLIVAGAFFQVFGTAQALPWGELVVDSVVASARPSIMVIVNEDEAEEERDVASPLMEDIVLKINDSTLSIPKRVTRV